MLGVHTQTTPSEHLSFAKSSLSSDFKRISSLSLSSMFAFEGDHPMYKLGAKYTQHLISQIPTSAQPLMPLGRIYHRCIFGTLS
jgi:hypothetical protein